MSDYQLTINSGVKLEILGVELTGYVYAVEGSYYRVNIPTYLPEQLHPYIQKITNYQCYFAEDGCSMLVGADFLTRIKREESDFVNYFNCNYGEYDFSFDGFEEYENSDLHKELQEKKDLEFKKKRIWRLNSEFNKFKNQNIKSILTSILSNYLLVYGKDGDDPANEINHKSIVKYALKLANEALKQLYVELGNELPEEENGN